MCVSVRVLCVLCVGVGNRCACGGADVRVMRAGVCMICAVVC